MSLVLLASIAGIAPPQDRGGAHRRDDAHEWSISLTTFAYFVPGERDFAGGAAAADRGWIHLEVRYNYEDLRTGSFFAGWNGSAGGEVKIAATLMVGAVAGETDAVAPAGTLALSWKALEAYFEGEYLFDLEDASDNFFYSWVEIAVRPIRWLRFGLVGERSQAFSDDDEFHAGVLAGIELKGLEFTVHLLDADLDEPVTVLSLRTEF